MFRKKINCRLIAAFAVLAAIFLVACPNDDSEPLEDPPPSPLVNFKVNDAGNAFENTGTNTEVPAPTVVNGEFKTVNGLKVFNTGGTKSDTQSEIPWWEGNYWDDYTDIGYVDLGVATGNLLGTLESFTIETYLKLPADAQVDRVGQYVWAFADQIAPTNAVWLNYREFTFLIKDAAKDPTDESVIAGWDAASPLHGLDTWHHLLVTKDSTTAVIYLDGEVVVNGPSTYLTTVFASGTLDTNYLGKPCYDPGVYDQGLFGTLFYSFAIYGEALSANLVKELYQDGPINTLRN
ncbi:MAG: LamG domain-containing protein [Treponema sp.]|jgi:hypothetical protein|nr:LamG domain-containing protein [Treponema sp.]